MDERAVFTMDEILMALYLVSKRIDPEPENNAVRALIYKSRAVMAHEDVKVTVIR